MEDVYEMTVKHIARACHEMNRAWCMLLGDDSQSPWEKAQDWQKDSAIQGVKNIIEGKVKSPEESHKSWMSQKLAEGWVYGVRKDVEAKKHPCLVPFEQLPPEQKMKDQLFFMIVKTMKEMER